MGAVGILDDDAVDGKEDFRCFADRKLIAEGGLGDVFNLRGSVALFHADRFFCRLCDEPMLKFCFRSDRESWVLQVEAVGISRLHNETFFSAAIDPRVEKAIFNI